MVNALFQSKFIEFKYKKILSLFAIILLIIPSYIFPSIITSYATVYTTAFAQSANNNTSNSNHPTSSSSSSSSINMPSDTTAKRAGDLAVDTNPALSSATPASTPSISTTHTINAASPTASNNTPTHTTTPTDSTAASGVSTANATTSTNSNAASVASSAAANTTSASNTTSNVLASSFPSANPAPATSTTYGVNNYATYAPNNFPTFPNNGVDTDKAPAFLDAYWTNYLSASSSVSSSAVKKEVGPGDGASTLAVVLVNAGRNDITGVTGFLNLSPSSGFVPLPGENNGTQSVASAYSVVKAGNTFVLYFDMNVLKQAKVGGYSFPLTLEYTKVNQIGQLMTTFNVPFRLTGKVILDAIVENAQLTPSTPNHLKILIENKGTASATGVVATVLGMTNNGYSSSSSSNNGLSSTSSTNAFVGTQSSSSSTANFAPAANSFANINTTNSPVQQAALPSVTSVPAVNIGSTTFNVGTVPANGPAAQINPIIYPSLSAGSTAQNLNIQVTYGDAYGNQQTITFPIGLVILPSPPQSVLNVTSNGGKALIVPAGKIQPINLVLTNSDPKKPITNVVATLNSAATSVKVIGDSRWTFQSIGPQSKIKLSTSVLGANTIVSTPNVFTLTVDYVLGNQAKTDTLNVGSYIGGDIKVIAYGVDINYIAGMANIVGNLLNEGNVVGLFTTVELAKPASGKSFVPVLPPSQYLGDLSVDSPLPFSIPLGANNKTMASITPGVHVIPLKVVYSDDLKVSHTLILNTSINYQPSKFQPKTNPNAGSITILGIKIGKSIANIMFIAIPVIIIAAIVAIIFRKKRKSKMGAGASTSQNNKDMELFLDDISTAPQSSSSSSSSSQSSSQSLSSKSPSSLPSKSANVKSGLGAGPGSDPGAGLGAGPGPKSKDL